VDGISFLLIAIIFRISNRWLIGCSIGVMLAFPAMMLVWQFDQHWDWNTLTYHQLWTLKGFVRNLFFDGFRSVFPWSGLLLMGMWIGRHDLRDWAVAKRFLIGGLTIALVSETLSTILQTAFVGGTRVLTAEDVIVVFGTESIPPLPLFLASAGGFATAMIAASVQLSLRYAHTPIIRALSATGQFALTWYVVHIVLGLGSIAALGLMGTQTEAMALGASTLFFLIAIGSSVVWKRFFNRGPLESIMRHLVG
jgi:uncharacterized membrane protein YeiB